MKKSLREQVRLKYNNKCAYTGMDLDDTWQVDHVRPQYLYNIGVHQGDKNDISNLLPTLRIINHYKRDLDLEGFRRYMNNFHIRLSKLPKNTKVERTIKRKEYLYKVAELFDISIDKPFNGIFYFETL